MTTTKPNYAEQYLKEMAKQAKELRKFIPTLPTLPGFTGKWEEDSSWFDGESRKFERYVLANATDQIEFHFNLGGGGTTKFKVADGSTRTFDRRGVEDSFYWAAFDYKGAETPVMSEVFAAQLERIAKSRKFFETSVVIPQIGFSTSPEGLAKLKKTLQAKGHQTFTPSGFGTGYTLSGKSMGFGSRATPALEEFLGISPVYVQSMDCD